MKYLKSGLAGLTVLFTLASAGANAALPAAIATELTSLQTDGLALADLVWPVCIALFGAGLLFTLFKRFGRKI